jgi:hypothetical protein
LYRPAGRRAARWAVAAGRRRAADHLLRRLLLSAGRIARILTVLQGRAAAGRIPCWTAAAAGRRVATATRRIPAAWVAAAILTGIPSAGIAVIRRGRRIAAAAVIGARLGRSVAAAGGILGVAGGRAGRPRHLAGRRQERGHVLISVRHGGQVGQVPVQLPLKIQKKSDLLSSSFKE